MKAAIPSPIARGGATMVDEWHDRWGVRYIAGQHEPERWILDMDQHDTKEEEQMVRNRDRRSSTSSASSKLG